MTIWIFFPPKEFKRQTRFMYLTILWHVLNPGYSYCDPSHFSHSFTDVFVTRVNHLSFSKWPLLRFPGGILGIITFGSFLTSILLTRPYRLYLLLQFNTCPQVALFLRSATFLVFMFLLTAWGKQFSSAINCSSPFGWRHTSHPNNGAFS